jgi:hypothetical protein
MGGGIIGETIFECFYKGEIFLKWLNQKRLNLN